MLSKQRQAQLVASLNGTATKVWESVPVGQPWERKQIMGELQRRGIGIDNAAVDGCLVHFCSIGLVKQTGKLYHRAPVRQEVATEAPPRLVVVSEPKQEHNVQQQQQQAKPAAARAASEYERLAEAMRTAAKQAADMAARWAELAEEAENAAVAALDAELSTEDKLELEQLRTWRGNMKQMLG